MDYDICKGPLKLGKQGEKCCLFRSISGNRVKRGPMLDLLRAPLKLLLQNKDGVGHTYV
jgi:hypothetical protein